MGTKNCHLQQTSLVKILSTRKTMRAQARISLRNKQSKRWGWEDCCKKIKGLIINMQRNEIVLHGVVCFWWSDKSSNPMPETHGYFQLKSICWKESLTWRPTKWQGPSTWRWRPWAWCRTSRCNQTRRNSQPRHRSKSDKGLWMVTPISYKISPTWLFLMHLKHLTMAIRRRRSRPMPVPPRISIHGMFGSAGQSGFGSPGATAWKIRRSRHFSWVYYSQHIHNLVHKHQLTMTNW